MPARVQFDHMRTHCEIGKVSTKVKRTKALRKKDTHFPAIGVFSSCLSSPLSVEVFQGVGDTHEWLSASSKSHINATRGSKSVSVCTFFSDEQLMKN